MDRLGERVAAIEQELRMRGPKHEEIERTMHGLTRQMDRVLLLGTQALQEIGTLSEGLETLRMDFTKHAGRSFIQIVRERWLEVLPWVGSAGIVLVLYPDLAFKIGLYMIGAAPD